MQIANRSKDLKRGVDHIGVSACAVVHDGNGKILLMKRGPAARDEQGHWDICGGAIEFGEPIIDALKREIKEELLTTPISIEFLTAYDAHRENDDKSTHWIALVHSVKVNPEDVKIGEPDKISEIGWFGLSDLPTPVHTQFHKTLEIATRQGIIH